MSKLRVSVSTGVVSTQLPFRGALREDRQDRNPRQELSFNTAPLSGSIEISYLSALSLTSSLGILCERSSEPLPVNLKNDLKFTVKAPLNWLNLSFIRANERSTRESQL